MEHPTLTNEEKKILEHVRAELNRELIRCCIPSARWPSVTLGAVIDLAGRTLQLVDHDTEPPPSPSGFSLPTRDWT